MWATDSGKALHSSLACLREDSLIRSALIYPPQDMWGRAAMATGLIEYYRENKGMPSSPFIDPGESLVLGFGE